MVIKADNGTLYASSELQEMCQKYGIFHKISSPYHSKSNGFAASMVKITKMILIKTQDSKDDPY